MNKVRECFKVLSIGLLAASCVGVPQTFAASKDMVVCYEDTNQLPWWQPISEDKGHRAGALVDMVIEAGNRLDIQPTFIQKSWNRCLASLKAGDVDAVLGSEFTPEQAKYGRFPMRDGYVDTSLAMARVSLSVFRRADVSWDFRDLNPQHDDVLIGVQRRHAAHFENQDLGRLTTTQHAPEFAMRMLSKGRLDGYVLEDRIGHSLMKKAAVHNIIPESKPLLETNWYLMLSPAYHDDDVKRAYDLWSAIAYIRDHHGATILKAYADTGVNVN